MKRTYVIWGRGLDKAASAFIDKYGHITSGSCDDMRSWQAIVHCTEAQLNEATTYFSRKVRGWKEIKKWSNHC